MFISRLTMKILVAMSGGVDSSVAAMQLTRAGHECVGCTMKLYGNADAGIERGHTCCSLDDVEDARSVARRLHIPYYVFNFSEGFREKVIGKFVDGYCRGVTPNPCIDCNRYMKFDKLYDRADVLGCGCIATGHYARIERRSEKYVLKKALDADKDQSYVLYTMTQAQLARTQFPLGALTKGEVRRLAQEGGLVTAAKLDSQDICFVPDGDYARVIELHTGEKAAPGDFIDTRGRVLGRHAGLICYTVGQHRGLGLSLPEKKYVVAIRPEDNTVVLGDEKELYSGFAMLGDVNWISGEAPHGEVRCAVKTRYRQQEQPARVVPLPGARAGVYFDAPQRAVTPGQAAVFYDRDEVLGGGVILRSGEAQDI